MATGIAELHKGKAVPGSLSSDDDGHTVATCRKCGAELVLTAGWIHRTTFDELLRRAGLGSDH